MKKKRKESRVMFGSSFCFLFKKICFWEYKEKIIFLYFWNKKHVWLVEMKKEKKFFEKKRKILKYVAIRI